MESNVNFTTGISKLLKWGNCFLSQGSSKSKCMPFVIDNTQVGWIRPDASQHLLKYKDVFEVSKDSSKIPGIHIFCGKTEERNKKVANVLEDLRSKDVLPALRGWRDEIYEIRTSFDKVPVLGVERAASGYFGFVTYGTHINGYTYGENGDMLMWISRRSKTKSKYPDMLDNICAGGLSSGLGVLECARKECQEEASISNEYLKNLKPANCISYCFEDERGVFPECEFCFDLLLPLSFKPINADGEVANFELLTIDQVKHYITAQEFKPNSGLVIIDFLIRHGIITPDNEPAYAKIIEMIHVPLQTMFSKDRLVID